MSKVYHNVFSLFPFDKAKILVHCFKFENDRVARREIAHHCVDMIIELASQRRTWNGSRKIMVQTIPSSPLRWLRYGFDHMLLLRWNVYRLLRQRDMRTIVRMGWSLRRVWNIEQKQAKLSQYRRKTGVRGKFKLRSVPSDTTVLVIDDVVTTGSTMGEALSVFEAAGIHAIGLTFCYQPLSNANPL